MIHVERITCEKVNGKVIVWVCVPEVGNDSFL